MFEKFGGWTVSEAFYPGGWVNDKTGKRVRDISRKYFVDTKRKDLSKIKSFMKKVSTTFKQHCIRFEHEGIVDYLEGEVEK